MGYGKIYWWGIRSIRIGIRIPPHIRFGIVRKNLHIAFGGE